MDALLAFIRRHPVATYFGLAFLISWGCILLIIGPAGFPVTADQRQSMTLGLAFLAGPSLAGILLTGLINGRPGFRDLRSRLFKRRVGARWYAIALLTAPILAALTSFALALLSPRYLPTIITTDSWGTLLLAALAFGVMVGFLEELGWTGFAIPRLRQRHGITATGLILGLLWGAWHFPIFWEGDSFLGPLGAALLISRLLSWLPPYRVLMVWVYAHTQSLLAVVLMHASLVVSSLTLQPTLTGSGQLIYILTWAGVLWAMVALVAASRRERLAAPAKRRGVS